MKYKLYDESIVVAVSTDGSIFTELWSTGGSAEWSDIPIDLSSYAGQSIYVRLQYKYDSGSYYTTGGVWIDSISTQEVTYPELEGQPVHYTVLTHLPAGIHTLAAGLTDTNAAEHGLGPAFTVTVTGLPEDGDGMPSEWEELYGLDPDVNDGMLDPDGDGYKNYEEYICGTIPNDASSRWLLEAGEGSLPAFYAREGRLYTILYRTNLLSGSWMPLEVNIPGSNAVIDVNDYDTATNASRYYRVQVLFED